MRELPAFKPLIQMLIDDHNMPLVGADALDEFAEDKETSVLFFTGDDHRLDESVDVAVALPELIATYGGKLTPCVIDRKDERALQLKYRFNAFPALVFLRKGSYLGVITRMQDWNDYVKQINEILASEAQEPPSFQLPDGCGTGEVPAAN